MEKLRLSGGKGFSLATQLWCPASYTASCKARPSGSKLSPVEKSVQIKSQFSENQAPIVCPSRLELAANREDRGVFSPLKIYHV